MQYKMITEITPSETIQPNVKFVSRSTMSTLHAILSLFCAASILLANVAQAQNERVNAKPETVVRLLFQREPFPNQYLAPAVADRIRGAVSIASQIPPNATVQTRAAYLDSSHASFETRVTAEGRTLEWYTFLVRDDGNWRINGLRPFMMPSLHYVIIDTMSARERRGELSDSLRPTFLRMKLAVASDSDLKEHLRSHLSTFERIAEQFRSEKALLGFDADQRTAGAISNSQSGMMLANWMREVGIGALRRDAHFFECEFLRIGSVEGSDVGYIYAPTGCHVPFPGPEKDFINVERVTPFWYVYKRSG